MRTITLLILHCSATRSDRRYTCRQCRHDHIHHRGYRDIGYHYYVEQDGTICTGRPEWVVGAHCRQHNRHSIGICYEGGLDPQGRPADTRTPAQRHALRTLMETLHRTYPGALIVGHRTFAPKDCPCFDAEHEYRDLNP